MILQIDKHEDFRAMLRFGSQVEIAPSRFLSQRRGGTLYKTGMRLSLQRFDPEPVQPRLQQHRGAARFGGGRTGPGAGHAHR